MALRALRRAKQGIDASKLAMGDPKKRKHDETEEGKTSKETIYGLQRPKDEEADPLADQSVKARRAVRNNNFTQQTNTLDVDKHMMAYIEENLKVMREQQRAGPSRDKDADDHHTSEQDVAGGIIKFGDKYKTTGKEVKEGSVTTSLAMLSGIPEVDLGMDARLRNIQETEKAKRAAAEEKLSSRSGQSTGSTVGPGLDSKPGEDEARLAATRFYNPHLRQQSDEALLKQAKLQALGLPPPDPQKRHRTDRQEMATDEAVMERFRKRMKR